MKITDAVLRRVGRLIERDNAPIGLLIHTRYSVERRIARGGMGEIFLARDTRLNRPVAMKILASKLSDAEWTERFKAEAQTMGQIDHPGIVPIHDIGLLPDGRLYYTMKLVDGLTLEELINAGQERARLLRVLARTCDVLHVAHEMGVIHRDLKPSNIMVDDSDQVYVLDWGIARAMDEFRAAGGEGAVTGMGLTSAGTILGTLQYMPPEQARGDLASIDVRSDVYSLGAIFYEILTGEPPVSGANETEILEAVAKGRIVTPRERNPSLPTDLEAICLKALRKHPRQRYQTARAMANDLRRWLNGDPVLAHPQTLAYRFSKLWAKRKALLMTGAIAVMACGSFGIYWLSHREDRALAEAMRIENEIFGPIQARLDKLSEDRDGWKRGIELLKAGLARDDRSWEAWKWLGELHEKRAEYEEAFAAYRSAYSVNPKLAALSYASGRVLMDHLRRNDEARRDFERALIAEPENEYALIGRARIAVLDNDYRKAMEMCRRAAPVGEHVPDLFFVRGYIYNEGPGALKDHRMAAADFRRVIEKRPWSSNAHTNLGRALREAGDLEGAVKAHEKSVALNPSNALAYTNLGVARYDVGDIEGALAAHTKAIELDRDMAGAYTNRSQPLVAKGEIQRALADLDRALELDSELQLAWSNRGAARHMAGDYDGAIADFTKAIELGPEDHVSYSSRGAAREKKSDFEGAIADHAKAIELAPNWAEAYYNCGIARAAAGDLQGAIADYTKAVDVDPGHAKAYSNRGYARFDAGDLDGAIQDQTKAIKLDPGLAKAYANRGRARREKGDPDGAIADLAKAVELDPIDAVSYSNRGVARYDKGDTAGALEDWTKAIELDPRHANSYRNRSVVRRGKGDFEGAIADCTKLIELNARDASAYSDRGASRYDKGDYKGAVTDLTKAVEINPRLRTAYLNRGLARKALRDISGAIADFTRVIELNPRSARAYYNRAVARNGTKEVRIAIEDYTRAIEIKPGFLEAYVNRGAERKSLGDLKGAGEDWEKALELAPANWAHRESLKKALRELGTP